MCLCLGLRSKQHQDVNNTAGSEAAGRRLCAPSGYRLGTHVATGSQRYRRRARKDRRSSRVRSLTASDEGGTNPLAAAEKWNSRRAQCANSVLFRQQQFVQDSIIIRRHLPRCGVVPNAVDDVSTPSLLDGVHRDVLCIVVLRLSAVFIYTQNFWFDISRHFIFQSRFERPKCCTSWMTTDTVTSYGEKLAELRSVRRSRYCSVHRSFFQCVQCSLPLSLALDITP